MMIACIVKFTTPFAPHTLPISIYYFWPQPESLCSW